MRVLWVATKAPWPLIDGGRVVMFHTLGALAAAGVEVVLSCPIDPEAHDPDDARAALRAICQPRLWPGRPRPIGAALAIAVRTRQPLPIARHTHPGLAREVARLIADEHIDVVHAEQLQALPQCAAAVPAGVPLVLRCQNVESDLWRATGAGPLRAQGSRLLATGFSAWEGRAVGSVDLTIALSRPDAARLRELAPTSCHDRFAVLAAPHPVELPAGGSRAGQPALVLAGSSGWRPNRDGASWFLSSLWPTIRARHSDAVLHMFGSAPATPGVLIHPAPADSRDCFPAGAICVVPLRYGAGVRIRILEAWARGLPVVASPAAAAGLDARDGHELLICDSAEDWSGAIARLSREPALGAALVAAGRTALATRHRPEVIGRELAGLYQRTLERRRADEGRPPPRHPR